MENQKQLSTAVNLLCDIATQHFSTTQQLTVALAAIQEVLKDQVNSSFQQAYRNKIQDLQRGKLGQQIAQDKAEFDRRMFQVKSFLQ